MAKKIFEIEELELQDGTKVTVKPLPIKKLREFMAIFSKGQDVESDEEGVEFMLEAATLAIAHYNATIDPDVIEDVLDLPTMLRVLEVAGGLDFDNPNLMRAATGRT